MAGINFGNTSYGSLANFRAKVAAQPKPELPPSKTNIEKRPEDAPKLPPAYEKRNDKPGFGGIA